MYRQRCIQYSIYSTATLRLSNSKKESEQQKDSSFPNKLGGGEGVASAGYDRWSESLKFIDQNCIPYSGKYWQGFKLGSLAIFRKSAKFISPPAMYVSNVSNALAMGIKGL